MEEKLYEFDDLDFFIKEVIIYKIKKIMEEQNPKIDWIKAPFTKEESIFHTWLFNKQGEPIRQKYPKKVIKDLKKIIKKEIE